MRKSVRPVRAGDGLLRRKHPPRQKLTKEQLRDAAALDRWLSEHEVSHREIAEHYNCTEQLISHHRNGRTAINELWKMRYADFFGTVPQIIFPSWPWSAMTPGEVPPSLARLAPNWNRLRPEQREMIVEIVRRESRSKPR